MRALASDTVAGLSEEWRVTLALVSMVLVTVLFGFLGFVAIFVADELAMMGVLTGQSLEMVATGLEYYGYVVPYITGLYSGLIAPHVID